MSHLLDATDYRARSLSPKDTAIDVCIIEHVSVSVLTPCIINKIDSSGVAIPCRVNAESPEMWLSTRDGLGVELSRAASLEIAGWQGGDGGLYPARERHLAAPRAACEHLIMATEHAAQQAQSLDLFTEGLRLAQEVLNSITGVFSSDDLLEAAFSWFCTGK